MPPRWRVTKGNSTDAALKAAATTARQEGGHANVKSKEPPRWRRYERQRQRQKEVPRRRLFRPLRGLFPRLDSPSTWAAPIMASLGMTMKG
jgi:hypothetical protein